VSYNEKHNEANGEGNRDGANDNNSWNCGAEGPTDDPAIKALRERQKRNFIATLFFSEGVPMLLAGDELSHTQKGNNNTYCQDNDLTWLHWELNEGQRRFLEFVRLAARIRKEQPVFQRRKFFQGRKIRGHDIKDISWINPAGQEMSDDDWNAGFVKCLGVRLAGDLIGDVDERGEPIVGSTLLLLMNAHHEPISFTLPGTREEHHWERMLESAGEGSEMVALEGGDQYKLQGRAVALFQTKLPEETGQVMTEAQAEALRRQARRVPQATASPP
ncbi:MAG: glycogen debranching enzyme GlgX, partial [Gemmataceae bacterium]|nr:glycogen debranching enzyme GlgX [Gemmataceae bacterium]